MQLSSLLEKMWYASATSSSGMRCVMISLRLDAPGLDVLDQARQVALHAGLVHARIVRPLFTTLPIGTALKVGP